MEATGSSLIIWFRNQVNQQIYVLVGKESNYIEDNVEVCRILLQNGLDIQQAQRFSDVGNRVDDKMAYFRKGAQKIEDVLHTEVHYDTPVYHIDKKEWTVHYRHLTGIRKGIVKGGRHTKEEAPIQTIKRECCEELYQYANFPMTYLGMADHYAVYFHQIYQLNYVHKLMAEIQKRRVSKYGEIWDFEFVPLDTILENRREYNKKTVVAIELFCQTLCFQ